MLVDFSKDVNPIVGLAKALGMSLGRPVCWDKTIGEQFATESLRRRRVHEEMVRKRDEDRRQTIEATEGIIDEMIDYTVHVCDSVVIEDIPPEESEIDVEELAEGDLEVENDENEEILKYLGEIMEDEEYGFSFTNTACSFEVEPAPALAYFLPFDVLIAVITTALPWHAKVQNIEDKSFREMVEEIYYECKNPDFNFNVLSHEFLNHPKFVELLGTISRFEVKVPAQIVEDILKEREGEERQKSL